MKAIKNKILSVLLFSFAFLIMHDHLVVNIYEDVKCELSSKEHSIISSLDIKSNIHDAIHTSLDLNREEELVIQLTLLENIPSTPIIALTSYTHLVPQRPPLT